MNTRHYGVWPEGRPFSLPPSEQSVFANLVASAERDPDRPAIIYYGGVLTFGELLRQVNQVAGHLAATAGLKPDDRVALYMQNAPQFVIAYYAILAANAVVVPINPMCRRAELQHILQDSGSRAICFGAELSDEVDAVWVACGRPALISARYRDYIDPATNLILPAVVERDETATVGTPWEDVLAADLPAPEHARGPHDWCMIPYSSGTTGHPKGCLHAHLNVNTTIRVYPDWVDMRPGSRILATLPFCHVTGMQHSMNLPIYNGSTMYLLTRWNARNAAQLIERERIQHWRSITTMMIDFLSLPDVDKLDVSSLEGVGGGGAQMPESIARRMVELIGLDYVEAYGLTETCAPIHINPPAAPKKQCLGVPIFDVDTRIVDQETLGELGPNQQGEIVTHAPQVFLGYWKRPDETKAAFVELDGKPFFRTGDIGYVNEEGYFFFVDRLKRMINVSGLKVWPAEVEAILHGHEDISEACVVGDADPRSGEAVRAVLVLKEGRAAPEMEELAAWCRANMAAYKIPQRFEFRETLPRTAAGKVRLKDL